MSRRALNYYLSCLFCLATGCGDKSPQIFKIGNSTYSFPAASIQSKIVNSEGSVEYLNVVDVKTGAHIIYSVTDSYATNYSGEETPLVGHINDILSKDFEVHDFDEGKTVCRPEKPTLSCGLRTEDYGTEWSVLFSSANVQDSPAMRRSALETLRRSRT